MKTDEQQEVVAEYRRLRSIYLEAAGREDEAFVKWFNKRRDGEPTNAGAASRLANRTSQLSAELACAQLALYGFGLDPADIDRADGISRDIAY